MSFLGLSVIEIICLSVVAVLLFLFLLLLCLGELLLSLSLKRDSFIGKIVSKETRRTYSNYKIDLKWWKDYKLEEVCVTSYDGKKLYPMILPAKEKTDKVAIIIHGYNAKYQEMNKYAELFYNLGYNVVLTQNRAHGKSEGRFIGMGWLDRLDMLEVIDMCVKKFGDGCKIDIFGLSMGAATVCMLSGEKLPPNVKHLISDCAYASVYKQFKYVYETYTKLPAGGLTSLLNIYAKIRCGYSIKNADARTKLPSCKVPILFIHGEKDTFVPYSNLKKLYDATPENLRHSYTFSNAGHAESLPYNEEKYTQIVKEFLKDDYGELN